MGNELTLTGIAMLVVAMAAAGVVTGIISGLLGIGGGAVLVPILFEVFRLIGVPDAIRMHLSVGTSLAIIIPTSINSFRSHHAKGAVDMDVLKVMGPMTFIGVVAGIFLARSVEGSVLKTVYIISCVILCIRLFIGAERLSFGKEMPPVTVQRLWGAFVGLVSTLIGVGGGIFITAMMSMYGRSIHRSVATAAGFGPIIAIPAALGYVWAGLGAQGLPFSSVGYVNILAALLIMPTSVWAAPIGVRIAHGLSRRNLELAFAVFLAVMAVRFFATL